MVGDTSAAYSSRQILSCYYSLGCCSVVHSQKTVTAYLRSKQLPSFVFLRAVLFVLPPPPPLLGHTVVCHQLTLGRIRQLIRFGLSRGRAPGVRASKLAWAIICQRIMHIKLLPSGLSLSVYLASNPFWQHWANVSGVLGHWRDQGWPPGTPSSHQRLSVTITQEYTIPKTLIIITVRDCPPRGPFWECRIGKVPNIKNWEADTPGCEESLPGGTGTAPGAVNAGMVAVTD